MSPDGLPCLFCATPVPEGTYHACGRVAELSPNAPQPAPMPGADRPTWELVVEDLDQRSATLALMRADALERDRVGAAKYGIRHQHDNGRDHLIDAYQECLDQALYLRAEIEKRKTVNP